MRTETIFLLFGIVMIVVPITSIVRLGREYDQTNYTIYAVDEDSIRQVDKFVLVPRGSITCPNDLKLQQPRYVFVERAEK